MTRIILIGAMLVVSQAIAQNMLTKPLQQKSQLGAIQEEKKVFQGKKMKNKLIPRGTIATH